MHIEPNHKEICSTASRSIPSVEKPHFWKSVIKTKEILRCSGLSGLPPERFHWHAQSSRVSLSAFSCACIFFQHHPSRSALRGEDFSICEQASTVVFPGGRCLRIALRLAISQIFRHTALDKSVYSAVTGWVTAAMKR